RAQKAPPAKTENRAQRARLLVRSLAVFAFAGGVFAEAVFQFARVVAAAEEARGIAPHAAEAGVDGKSRGVEWGGVVGRVRRRRRGVGRVARGVVVVL